MVLPRNARIQWRMTRGVFQSLYCVVRTSLPGAGPASSGQPCPGKIWPVRSESAWSALTLGGDPCSHGSLEQETTLKKGMRTKHQSLMALDAYRFFFFVLKWHVILLLIMLFWPIWIMPGLAALDAQDMIAYSCTWLNTEAQLIVLNQFTQWWKQNFRVGSDPNSHLVPPCGLCLCNLHIFKWLFSFWLYTHTNVCERKLNTSGGSRLHLGQIWPSYMNLSLMSWTSNHWPWYH